MSTSYKCQTLRNYLQSYKNHQRVNSSQILNLHQIYHQYSKFQLGLFHQIINKLNQVKKQLSGKDLNKIKNSVLRNIYDLENLVESLFGKLRLRESTEEYSRIASSLKNQNKKFSFHKSNRNKQSSIMETDIPVIHQIQNTLQIQPMVIPIPAMSRDVAFSSTLTPLCISTFTQEQTPKSNENIKENTHRLTKQQPSEERYFKNISMPLTAFSQCNVQREIFNYEDDSIIYVITTPKS